VHALFLQKLLLSHSSIAQPKSGVCASVYVCVRTQVIICGVHTNNTHIHLICGVHMNKTHTPHLWCTHQQNTRTSSVVACRDSASCALDFGTKRLISSTRPTVDTVIWTHASRNTDVCVAHAPDLVNEAHRRYCDLDTCKQEHRCVLHMRLISSTRPTVDTVIWTHASRNTGVCVAHAPDLVNEAHRRYCDLDTCKQEHRCV